MALVPILAILSLTRLLSVFGCGERRLSWRLRWRLCLSLVHYMSFSCIRTNSFFFWSWNCFKWQNIYRSKTRLSFVVQKYAFIWQRVFRNSESWSTMEQCFVQKCISIFESKHVFIRLFSDPLSPIEIIQNIRSWCKKNDWWFSKSLAQDIQYIFSLCVKSKLGCTVIGIVITF